MTAWPLPQIEQWFLRAGLFLLPLAFWWDTYDHYVLPKLLVARVLVLGLLILYVARAISARTLAVKRTPLDLPWLAFIASAGLSTLFAENQNVAVFGIYSRYDGLVTILTYAALFWLSVQALDGARDARSLLRVLLASGYLVAVLAIIQSVTDSLAQGAQVPAFGTLGQKNTLGAFLALLCPLAYYELVAAQSWAGRMLALNALAVIGLALFLTFSRSAWLGAALAAVVVVAGTKHLNMRRAGLAAGALAIVGAVVTAMALAGAIPLERDLASLGDRPAIWLDSVNLIASRPLVGYGPDNVGLVYPRFQAKQLPQLLDKTHSEPLQVAATQGLVGLAAYGWMLAAFVLAFWRGRRADGAYPIFAAWVAYQVTLLLNFSALASAFPFWIFAAAGLASWGPIAPAKSRPLGGKWWPAVGGVVIAGAAGLAVAVTALPFLADVHLLNAVKADSRRQLETAHAEAQQARHLWPVESVYAVEIGNLAFERNDWAAARLAYRDAAQLGTYNPLVYRNLALADRDLGLRSEGEAAARKAVELDRFDPANQALLAQFEVGGP